MTARQFSYEHGGNVHAAASVKNGRLEDILDFSANINPSGPPEWLRSCISHELDTVLHYPDPYGSGLKKIIAEKYNVAAENALVANGSTELLYQLPHVIDCSRAVIPVPCYIDYIKVMELASIPVHLIELPEQNNFIPDLHVIEQTIVPGDLLILGSPNNPTGQSVRAKEIKNLATANPQVLFLIDEAFLEFVEGSLSLGGTLPNIITLHSLTKFYGIPGLRLGFGIFPDPIAADLRKIMPPWTVNSLAQKVGERALLDLDYQKQSREYFLKCKKDFLTALADFPDLNVFPSDANYLLVKLSGQCSVQMLQEKLAESNILIRDCSNYSGLENKVFFRIAIRNQSDNTKFIQTLSTILPSKKGHKTIRKTPAIMFQGTSSNAGKSVLTAALCRILLQDGVQVAPFKAQNMSLNSFVTLDGLEMGRAQVVQAQAARLDPDVLMNPILLKPNSDTGSQIIVRGKPIGNMTVSEYFHYKKEAMHIACNCYDELSADYQAVILEGAGSPGEVNLKSHDIVNMRMARYAESPVILVGDIDRGGVYASFVGTMEVLNQWERNLVAGFLVNRFRGKSELLQDAHDYVKAHTGKDVLGVIPYLVNHGIPEEDSVSFKEGLFEGTKPDLDHIEICIVNLPHISNFTDFEPFILEPDVHLRVISDPGEVNEPDVIILPGSKNVISDLHALHSTGMASVIQKQAEKGCTIVGICGGYMMLGNTIEDPYGIESQQSSCKGFSLLDMHTILAQDKTLTRKKGTHSLSDQPVVGYEIHHGVTRTDSTAIFSYDNGSDCGVSSNDGKIWGSYLHGIFDSDLFRRWFINSIRKSKGLDDYDGPQCSYNLEPAFDRLADCVRKGIDMDRVYELLRL
ncbi:MAG TPA: cobyric acid synthase [Desulfobacterales bacterium]|nr:cobyric acid synthase [Desulfobacterales bacterium]HIP40257.1 cobyric acid synthase [Desulfocapsa sulfexigens]